MAPLRTLIRRSPLSAALIVAAALLLRIAVPGGFMPTLEHGRVVLTVCTGMAAPAHVLRGMTHHGAPDDAAPVDGKCAYADLAQVMLGGADPVLLAGTIAYVLLLASTLGRALAPLAERRLRPPLRAPPLSA